MATAKYPTHLFMKTNIKYKYLGQTEVLETKTAPTKIKSQLQNFPKIEPKEISRLVYLTMPNKTLQPTAMLLNLTLSGTN